MLLFFQTRAAVLFVAAAACLLLFDNDDMMTQISEHREFCSVNLELGVTAWSSLWFVN